MKQHPDTVQADLEVLYSKYQLLPVLREQFTEISNSHSPEHERPFINDMLAQIYLHRQADPVTMVGLLSPKYGPPQEVSNRLLKMCELDFIDFNMKSGKFVVKYDVSEDIQTMLEKYQYPLPMVCPPDPITNNFDTGYQTIRGSIVLNGSDYFKDVDLCLDHLNRANSVALSLDFEVLESNEGRYIKPTRRHNEEFSEFNKRLRQADMFYNTSVEVMYGLQKLSDRLFITHKYDRRGRCYASGYHVNPQGTDYNKAVLQFFKKELVKS